VIYVRRDFSLIPEKVIKVAVRAQQELENLPAAERPAFIKKKSHIWRAFARYLSKMSYGKCWYSETLDPQSFFDVDHFRPKLEARRSEDVTESGYQWLAFSWDNFRYSAQRSNRVNKNEVTDDTEGKGNWFPLLAGSPKACWDNRCEDTEKPVLLDPVRTEDVRLIDVKADGRMGPSPTCVGSGRYRVERTIEVYGLNLPRLKSARLSAMREVNDLCEVLWGMIEAVALGPDAVADQLPIDKQLELIIAKTLPCSAYSKAARAMLINLGAAALCAQPEEVADLCNRN
jgi:hypothetical protein